MGIFEIGKRYGVISFGDIDEVVTIASRDAASVTLSDGRKIKVMAGTAPEGGDEEMMRIDECGAACKGVVRVCHVRC